MATTVGIDQLMEVVALRREFLLNAGLPRDLVMHAEVRQLFLRFAKDRFHAELVQQRLQARDEEKGGRRLKIKRMHMRWAREMQRRCGDKHVWELLSFTGRVLGWEQCYWCWRWQFNMYILDPIARPLCEECLRLGEPPWYPNNRHRSAIYFRNIFRGMLPGEATSIVADCLADPLKP